MKNDFDDEETKVEYAPLDIEEAASYIEQGGALSRSSSVFEERPSQIALLKEIAKAFNNSSLVAFEAGTGVGKSYAYLIPSMLWALQNKERVVISTGTINLQQQLIEKDIPAAKKIIGTPVKAVLMKGRNNYVCLRRLDELRRERDLFSNETELLERIFEWSKTSPSGSKTDISFMPPESLWSRIASESDACMGQRCPFHEKCFVMAVRRDASDAQILVVNHHLLFADIESRMGGAGYTDSAVLPPYKRIVFDEAHGIENAATSFFSAQVTRFKIMRQLNLLHRSRRGGASGYIFTLLALSNSEDNSAEIASLVEQVKTDIANLEISALDILRDDGTLRLYEKTKTAFAPVISLLTTLASSVDRLSAAVRGILENIADEDKTDNSYWESRVILRHLEDVASVCKDFAFWDEKRDMVFWIQRQQLPAEFVAKGGSDESRFYVAFTRTPLDIAPLMNAGVFEPMESVVNASATLKIAGSFDFWMRRTGLAFAEAERVKNASFASPFPYDKNVLFAIARDIPFADNVEFQRHIEFAIVKLIKASKGGALVLFTSYESLKSAASTAQYELSQNNIIVLKQGDDDRFRLLDKFKTDASSALFATDSFWQGVDVPGDSLRLVIIVKLPFSVPTDPVFAARAEAIEERGGSSFMELSVPEAVIKFRQGFGRLVRHSDDKGAVVVLDRRIMEKRYGKFFLKSIPETKTMYDTCDKISSAIDNLLKKN